MKGYVQVYTGNGKVKTTAALGLSLRAVCAGKNVFFGHLVTATVGMFFLYLIPLPLFIIIPLAVGFGVGLMILLNVTHPPAGGNPIIVIMGSVSLDYLLSPIISGSIIILVFAIIINKFILKKSYPKTK
jgi:CBS-domain-containing membrane protein